MKTLFDLDFPEMEQVKETITEESIDDEDEDLPFGE